MVEDDEDLSAHFANHDNDHELEVIEEGGDTSSGYGHSYVTPSNVDGNDKSSMSFNLTKTMQPNSKLSNKSAQS